MERIHIQATEYTPHIDFDPANGVIKMKGNSTPYNSSGFYYRMIINLEEYVTNETRGLTAHMAFRHFNTSSFKCVYHMFKHMTRMKKGGRQVTINWYYNSNDQEMYEVGKDFSESMNLPFNFIKLVA